MHNETKMLDHTAQTSFSVEAQASVFDGKAKIAAHLVTIISAFSA